MTERNRRIMNNGIQENVKENKVQLWQAVWEEE